jgi:D-alanyl-D-alanine carboxypeptidase
MFRGWSRGRAPLSGLAMLAAVLAAPAGHAGDPAWAGPCAEVTDAPAGLVAALDAALAAVVQGTFMGAAPGAVLSVAGPGWRYVRSAGMADPEAGRKVDCAMPFQIGSATKMMTAVVLLQLHEEGALSLDDPLSRQLPEVAARLPHGDAMTLRQLAQHTAGVFSYTDTAPDGTPGIAVASMSDPVALRRPVSPQDMIDFTLTHGQPSFAPGAAGQWAYSNTGYTLLGMVIERAEGLPLSKSFENRIFGPLEMHATYLWDDVPRADFGLPRSWLKPPFDVETTTWNLSQAWAGGGVISTVGDMHLFIRALVGGALFRSPATLAEMQQTVPSPIPGTQGYGLGLIRLEGDFWGHGGQTLGFIASVGASAGAEVSFVAWGNSAANPVAFIAADIADALSAAGMTAD